MPANPNYAQGVNVADQQNDPNSLLNFYRRMLRLRKGTPALIAGDYRPLHETAGDCFAFLRQSAEDRQTCLVALNLSEREQTLSFDLTPRTARCLFSTHESDGTIQNLSGLKIPPFGIYVGELGV